MVAVGTTHGRVPSSLCPDYTGRMWPRPQGKPVRTVEHVSRRQPPTRLSSLLSPQRLYYVKEAHGIVVTDVTFLPEKGCGPKLLGSHETALFSVAVDSRCQLHLLPSRRESSSSLLLYVCVCVCGGEGTTSSLAIANIVPGKIDCFYPSICPSLNESG